jgi:hypothetical protein
MFSTRRSLTSSGLTPDPLPPLCPETSAKAAERRPNAAGEVDFLEHCFIAKGVLIGSSNYFTAGPKRSASSFQSAMIFSVRVQGAVNVDPQGGQRAFDQILHAALRIGHRGGLVNAQRFLEQINRLIARAVKRLDKLLHTFASLRESVRRHRLQLRLELLGGAELGEQVFPEVH